MIEFFFCAEAPGRSYLLADRPLAGHQSRGGGGQSDSGACGGRRRRGTWGKARERREEPRGGLGWARGGLRRLLRGTEAPAAAVGGGGGGNTSLGGGGWVREYQWRARKVAAGVVGHKEGRKRGLGGELGGGGGHGGRRPSV